MIKLGDVVFFKRAKRSTNKKFHEASFTGYGFGVFLGHVPPSQPDPPAIILLRQLGHIGFLSFDDIKEFLGEESQNTAIEKFKDKYYGKVVQQKTQEILAAKLEEIKKARHLQPLLPAPPGVGE